MAVPKATKYRETTDAPGFDVNVLRTIGRVEYGNGEHKTPVHAAFALIADQAESGVYSFPDDGDGSVTVTVELPQPTEFLVTDR